MEQTLTQISRLLGDQSLQLAAVILVAGVAAWLLRRASAHVRYLLWLVVLAKCLVPPLISLPLPVLPADDAGMVATAGSGAQAAEVGRAGRFFRAAEGSASATLAPGQDPAGDELPDLRTLGDEDRVPRATPLPVLAADAGALDDAPAGAARADGVTWGWKHWAVAVWAAGAAAFLLLAGAKAWRINRYLRYARYPLDDELASELDHVARRLGLKTPPPAWLTDGASQPFVWGLLRGEVYLPCDFADSAAAAHRRQVLAHELAHVRRCDAGVNALQVLVQAAFFFHPLVWWANAALRREREKCCDETAIAALAAPPRQYGRAIVETLVAERTSRRPVPSLAVAGPVRNIEERIKTIMTANRTFCARPSGASIVVALLLATIIVPTAATLTARAEKPADNTPAPAAKPADAADDLKVTLPSGVMVELVGVGEHRPDGKWWAPTGELMSKPLYGPQQNYRPDDARFVKELALRVTDAAGRDFGMTWRCNDTTSTYSWGTVAGTQIDRLAASWRKECPTGKLYVGIAAGPWTTEFTSDGRGMHSIGRNENTANFAQAVEQEKGTIITYSFELVGDPQARLVAVDAAGRTHAGELGGVGGGGSKLFTAKFDLPLKKIKEFQLQSRPYDEWAEFKDISLQAGQKTRPWVLTRGPKGVVRVSGPGTKPGTDNVMPGGMPGMPAGLSSLPGTASPARPAPEMTGKLKTWVESFFASNYRDITARRLIEWGEPVRTLEGNYAIRYKYVGAIWDKDRYIFDQMFVFTPAGKDVSTEKLSVKPVKTDADIPPVSLPAGEPAAEMTGKLKTWVENFFAGNYRDITARELVEWGEPVKTADGNYAIRYKHRATIRERKTLLIDELFTFTPSGEFVSAEKLSTETLRPEPITGGGDAEAKLKRWVENFFANNYRDITARETIEWGQVEKTADGNYAIRYKCLATIHDKEKLIIDSRFSFTPEGEYVSSEKLSVEPVGEPLTAPADLDAKIAELHKPNTTAEDALRLLGEPQKYVWGQQTFAKDELPSQYMMVYPDNVRIVIAGGKVAELRSEGGGGGFAWQGLRLGSTLEEALALLGEPDETVVGEPVGWVAGTLYKDIDGRKGYHHYARPDKGIRLFFMGGRVRALYLTLTDQDSRPRPAASQVDFSDPDSVVTAFTRAAARGDVAAALACFAPDSHDLADMRRILTGPKDHPMRMLLEAADPDKPVEITKKEIRGERCEIAWKFTVSRDVSAGRMSLKKGQTFELDGRLKKVGEKWMIDGI